jgi:heat-inducible transcriptional repressor
VLHLLDRCLTSPGVQLFIGAESGQQVFGEVSLVTASYQVDGRVAGVLGVIGPTRMAYQRVIPMVDLTAHLLGAALEPGH